MTITMLAIAFHVRAGGKEQHKKTCKQPISTSNVCCAATFLQDMMRLALGLRRLRHKAPADCEFVIRPGKYSIFYMQTN